VPGARDERDETFEERCDRSGSTAKSGNNWLHRYRAANDVAATAAQP
jgi:hypothetical protein